MLAGFDGGASLCCLLSVLSFFFSSVQCIRTLRRTALCGAAPPPTGPRFRASVTRFVVIIVCLFVCFLFFLFVALTLAARAAVGAVRRSRLRRRARASVEPQEHQGQDREEKKLSFAHSFFRSSWRPIFARNAGRGTQVSFAVSLYSLLLLLFLFAQLAAVAGGHHVVQRVARGHPDRGELSSSSAFFFLTVFPEQPASPDKPGYLSYAPLPPEGYLRIVREMALQ